MLIKFFPRGRGGGAGPTEYLTGEQVRETDGQGKYLKDDDGQQVWKTREPPPEVLRGNVETTRALIDHCHHKFKYSSGVIAFAAEDAPTEKQQQQVMDDFEALAFAGLDADQYDILWVRHQHEGNVELHMVVPRQELTTGKALNIAPPGHSKYYDQLRDAWNYGQGWARPDDLARARIYTPDRTYDKPNLEDWVAAKEDITDWLMRRINAGQVTDRAGIVASLQEIGEITREGKNYVSVKTEDFSKALRLRGTIYGEEFDFRAIQKARNQEARGQGADREAHAERAQEARKALAGWVERRARYHEDRYQRQPERNNRFDQHAESGHNGTEWENKDSPDRRSGEDRAGIGEEPAIGPGFDAVGLAQVQPSGVVNLRDFLNSQLGSNAISGIPAGLDPGPDQPGTTEPEPVAAGGPVPTGRGWRILSDLRHQAGTFPDHIRRLGEQIKETLRAGYDRVRNEINQLVEGIRGRIERARESFAGAGEQLATAGGNLSAAGADLERASHQLSQSVRAPGRAVERGMEKLMENRNDELDRFKTQINLAEYAASQGYQLDRRESSRNSAVMRRESDDDKIIVATDTDGHGVYFSVRDDQDNGSIVDFVQRRKGLNLGQTRKELRLWLGTESLPVPERIRKPEPSSTDRRALIGSFAQMQLQPQSGHPYLLSRGISAATLTDPRFAGMIRQDHRGNAVFPHYDSQGLSGYELKNEGFTGFSRGGEKRVWHSANIGTADRVVVVESAIDALSYAELTGDQQAAYISIGGQPSPEQWQVLAAALANKQKQGVALVIGTDADAVGDKLAAQIAELAPSAERQRPTAKDWSDQLQAQTSKTGLQAEFERMQRERDDYEPDQGGPSLG